MAVRINFEGAKIGGNVKAFDDAVVSETADIDINFNNAEIKKNVDLMSNAEIVKAIADAEKKLPLNSDEYKALQKLDSQKTHNAVLDHLATFATGTLANIVAEYVMMR